VRRRLLRIPQCAPDVAAQILKLLSVCLCSNLAGQVATYAMVHPPRSGDPSYELYNREKRAILEELKLRAALLVEGLNKIDGVSCNCDRRRDVRLSAHHAACGVSDEEYCMAPARRDRHLRGARIGFGQRRARPTSAPPSSRRRRRSARWWKSSARFTSPMCL